MKLTCRAATRDDFADFYETCFYRDRDNAALRGIVKYEWDFLRAHPAAITLLVEEGCSAGRRIVGCGQVVFVTDRFAAWAKSGQSPKLNMQATHPMPDGSSPLLTAAQVAAANAKGGLNGLYTRWWQANQLFGPAEQLEIRRFMHDAGIAALRGYRLKELLIQAYGEPAHEHALNAGFLDRTHYDEFARCQPVPPDDLPFLMGITREEAAQKQGHVMPYLFIYHPPRFGFTRQQQKMLCLCLRLQDAPDTKLAEALDVSVSAVKNWWQLIYERVGKADPDLLPPASAGQTRGPEKRRLLLQYLREHPEELRPYTKPRRAGMG